MLYALRHHWPEYLLEAIGLGIFMLSACAFATLLFHPASPAQAALAVALRPPLMGLAMGLTAIAIVYSPLGKRSGGHLNPALTLTFFRLGKIAAWDAFFYVLAQFAGGVAGVWLAILLLGMLLADPAVNYVATLPGPAGASVAFLAETIIAFLLMLTVLVVSNTMRLARLTGLCAGALVALFIAFEAPLSGMSMNPARTFGSALWAQEWTALWLYFTAPPLGMLLAAAVYTRARGTHGIVCAKLHHQNSHRCIFRCGYKPERVEQQSAAAAASHSRAGEPEAASLSYQFESID